MWQDVSRFFATQVGMVGYRHRPPQVTGILLHKVLLVVSSALVNTASTKSTLSSRFATARSFSCSSWSVLLAVTSNSYSEPSTVASLVQTLQSFFISEQQPSVLFSSQLDSFN
jgi:hypothetical protein